MIRGKTKTKYEKVFSILFHSVWEEFLSGDHDLTNLGNPLFLTLDAHGKICSEMHDQYGN